MTTLCFKVWICKLIQTWSLNIKNGNRWSLGSSNSLWKTNNGNLISFSLVRESLVSLCPGIWWEFGIWWEVWNLRLMSTYYLCGIGDLVAKSRLTLATGCQAPLFIGFPKQEYWSGLPCPSPRDLPDPGIEPRSPTLQAVFFVCFVFNQLRHQGSTHIIYLTWIQQMLIENLLCLRNWETVEKMLL